MDYDALELDDTRMRLAWASLLIAAGGVGLNGALLWIIGTRHILRDTHMRLVAGIAAFDLLLSLWVSVKTPFFLAAGSWVGGEQTCRLSAATVHTWATGQPMLLALLPADQVLRFQGRALSARASRWTIAAVFAGALAYGAAIALTSDSTVVVQSYLACAATPSRPLGRVDEFLVPLCLVFVVGAFAWLAREVRKRFHLEVEQELRVMVEARLWQRSAVLVGTFVISWLPGYLLLYVDDLMEWPEWFGLSAVVITYAHVVINPLAYGFANARVKKEVSLLWSSREVGLGLGAAGEGGL